MKHYALTGGIGSGKSTVLSMFEDLGVPTFAADESAKHAMEHDAVLRDKIIATFGAASYNKGKLNRPFIADQVFGNDEKLSQLNAIVHPAAREAYINWQKQQDTPYTLYEFPLVFELGEQDRFDGVILVVSPDSQRIERVQIRDNTTEQSIRNRMLHQWSDEKKIPLTNMIIQNNSLDETNLQVAKLHQQLLQS